MGDVYEIQKQIRKNVNDSDILQKANALLDKYMHEELLNEKHHYEHSNDYMAHLKCIHELKESIEKNEKQIHILATEYVLLKKKLLEAGGEHK